MGKSIKHSGIYKITCIINGIIYIGSTINLKNRKNCHFKCLRKNTHGNKKLQRSFNKHGEENFIFEILEYCEKTNLVEREQYYLDTLLFASENNTKFNKLGFNICRRAGNTLGTKRTEESKEKMREARKNIVYTDEWRSNLSKALKGRIGKSWNKGKTGVYSEEVLLAKSKFLKENPINSDSHPVWSKGKTGVYSKETIKKMSQSGKEKIFTDQHKLNISIKAKGRKLKESVRIERRKKIEFNKKECPYCNRVLDPGNYKQFHGDVCKFKN